MIAYCFRENGVSSKRYISAADSVRSPFYLHASDPAEGDRPPVPPRLLHVRQLLREDRGQVLRPQREDRLRGRLQGQSMELKMRRNQNWPISALVNDRDGWHIQINIHCYEGISKTNKN